MTPQPLDRKRAPLDKDLFFSQEGDIYQVITNVHPSDRVVALCKYDYHAEKPPDTFFWQSSQKSGYFTRSMPNYNASNATNNITKSNYHRISHVFGVPMIEVPHQEITTYLYPEDGLREWLNVRNETEWSMAISDIANQFEIKLDLKQNALGITGSLLWAAQHPRSDIDFVVYGIRNTLNLIHNAQILSTSSGAIHRPMPEFIERSSNTLAKKTGLPFALCRKYIEKKSFYLYFQDKFLSLGFAPLPEEVSHHYDTYSFQTITPIKVTARILDDSRGYFYPGEYLIEVRDVEIQGPKKHCPPINQLMAQIKTLLVMEREISGYYFPGDVAEIRGMLQQVSDNQNKYYQIILGTRELFGHEWVRVLSDSP